jgi:hypothetical protein
MDGIVIVADEAAMNEKARENATLYERDFVRWVYETAPLIEANRLDEVDLPHLLEEFFAMAGSDERELFSRMRILVSHLLKWKYRPDRRGASWASTISTRRDDLDRLLMRSPSLRRLLAEERESIYSRARRHALVETRLPPSAIPLEPPFTLDQALDEEFLPD